MVLFITGFCSQRCSKVEVLARKLKNIGLVPAISEEHPTSDSFEVEIDFL